MSKNEIELEQLMLYGLSMMSKKETELFHEIMNNPEKNHSKESIDANLRVAKDVALLSGVAAMIQLNNQKLQEKLKHLGVVLDEV